MLNHVYCVYAARLYSKVFLHPTQQPLTNLAIVCNLDSIQHSMYISTTLRIKRKGTMMNPTHNLTLFFTRNNPSFSSIHLILHLLLDFTLVMGVSPSSALTTEL